MKENPISLIHRKKIILGPTNVICDPAIQRLCLHPYFNHSNGCPKYGKKIDCPPQADFFLDLFGEKVYVAAVIFDFKEYLNLKKKQHLDWTDRALRNSRHWQNHLKSEIKKFIFGELFVGDFGDSVIFNPEAMGVNVTQTCENAGLKLEWPPRKIVCQVALIGTVS